MRLLLLIILLTLGGCQSARKVASHWQQESLTIKSGGCGIFSANPMYEVTIFPNATVEYVGKAFVYQKGNVRRKFRPDLAKNLLTKAHRFRPETGTQSNSNHCSPRATDQDSVQFVWRNLDSGNETSFDHYLGCLSEQGKLLSHFLTTTIEALPVKDLIELHPNSLKLSLLNCQHTCRDYSIEVFSDGKLIFDGAASARQEVTSNLTRDEVSRAMDVLTHARWSRVCEAELKAYLKAERGYEEKSSIVFDAPFYRAEWKYSDSTKNISDALGQSVEQNRALHSIALFVYLLKLSPNVTDETLKAYLKRNFNVKN